MALPKYPKARKNGRNSAPKSHDSASEQTNPEQTNPEQATLPSAPSVPAADLDTAPPRATLRDRFPILQKGILDRDHPKNKWFMLSVLAAGLAIVVLDGTIVSIALPTIIRSLHLTITEAQWVTALYSVIFAAILMSTGGLADRIGRRRTFFIGLVIFLIGSILAGSSISSSALIISRAIQGIGGAFVLPSTLASVHTHFDGRERHLAFGVWGAVMSGTAAVGPLLGGLILKYASWQYIFLINVPIVLFIMLGTALFVPNSKGEAHPLNPTGFDPLGFLLSAIGIAALVFGIIEGPRLGWWTPNTTLKLSHNPLPNFGSISAVPVFMAGGILLIVLFLVWEHFRAKAGKHVILNLTLFKIPTFTWGNLTAGTIAVGQFCLVFLLPLYLLNCLQVGYLKAGVVLAMMAIGALTAGAFSRAAAERVSPAGVVIIGLAMEVVAVTIMAATVDAATSIAVLIILLLIYGVGLGFASAQLTSTVLRDVPVAVSGMGASTQSTVRQLGTATGFALAGTVLTMSLSSRLPDMLGSFGAPDKIVNQLTNETIASAGSNLQELFMPPFSDFLVLGFADSIAETMWVTVGFLCVGFVAALQVWRVSRKTVRAKDLV